MDTTRASTHLPQLSAELLRQLTPTADTALPKVRQLYLNFYQAIEQGLLPFDTRLPSSRELAKAMGLGRNTVISVYDQLVSEGLLAADGRRGTRVARQITTTDITCTKGPQLSQRAQHTRSSNSQFHLLAPGEPDTTLFPPSAWYKAQTVATRRSSDQLGYQPRAVADCREAIARYLTLYRSLRVDPEQIVVTSGTRQSLMLAALLFADIGDTAWLECPGYAGAVDACQQAGLTTVPCRIDHHGIRIPATPANTPRLIYTTPCFQYPFGMPLAAERRSALLNLSRQYGSVIFEDDYDSEFRDDSQPRPSLAAEANGAHVLHAGTFSKILFPAIRLGWLVVDQSIAEQAYRCLKTLGGGNNTVAQLVVTELLNNGSIARHLKHARHIYGQRRIALTSALSNCDFTRHIAQVYGSLSLVLHLKSSVPLQALEQCLAEQSLGVQALERLDWQIAKPTRCKAIVVGLGNVDTLSIPTAVNKLNIALKQANTKR